MIGLPVRGKLKGELAIGEGRNQPDGREDGKEKRGETEQNEV